MVMLADNELSTLKDVINSCSGAKQYKVVLFGSRATGKARRYSDIDLALIGEQPVAIRTLSALSEAFENSSLPYTVDVVDFKRADSSLQQQITLHGQELSFR